MVVVVVFVVIVLAFQVIVGGLWAGKGRIAGGVGVQFS